MWIFYVLLLVPVMIQHTSIRGYHVDYEKKNKWALAFFFFLLTLLVMFRHESVGNDTRNYISIFKKYAVINWDSLSSMPLETGYSYLNKLISIVSKEPQFFLAIVALMVSIMIYPTYKRLCIDTSLTIVLFCTMSTFIMMFSGIRQMLAIGIGFIAYEFTRKKKLIAFIFTVILAMAFHTSAFMLIFMYPLYHAKITKSWLLFVVPALGVVFVFNKQIFSFLSVIISQFTGYEGEIASTGAYTMLLLFIAFKVFSFLIPDETGIDEEIIGLRNFLLLSLALQMFAPLHSLAMRMNYYYIIFIPLLIPKIVSYRNKTWGQVAIAGRHIMVVFFLIYFFVNAYTGDNLNVFPYRFFWETVR